MNKKQFSKGIVAMVIILNTIFTIAVFYVFLKTGNEPTTLITFWFGFTTTELWMLASIRKTKAKNENMEGTGEENE